MDKYGVGEVFSKSCPSCSYVQELSSAGVHESDNGIIRVYTDDDEFICPKCSEKSNNVDCAGISLRV